MIGFGSVETEFEEAEGEAFKDYVWDRYKSERPEWLDGSFSDGVYAWLKGRAKQYEIEAKAFRSAKDHPDRYSTIYPWVLSCGQYIVAIITFHHINRRHAFSPDGWALMQTDRCFYVRKSDMDDAIRQQEKEAQS